MKRILAGVMLVGALSCAYVSPPVAVVGSQPALRELAGEWWGDYRSEGPIERRGSIHFTLIVGEDHAHGDVLMTPAGSNRPYGRFAGEPGTRQMPATPEALSIRIVRVEDGAVRGDLEPYWDPDRETTATTTFRGTLREGTIAGTFITTFASGALEARGRWRVNRVTTK
jgi:hypothetical protein